MAANSTRLLFPFLLSGILGACGGGGGGGGGNGAAASAPGGTATSQSADGALAANLGLEQVATGLSSPLYLTEPAGDARLFIVERPGRIRILQNGALLPAPFLDISDRTATDGEQGLLSVAFDPQYAANGLFYVYYTDANGDIAIDRFRVSATDPNLADPASDLRILSIPHPGFNNHYGGQLSFGPDGMLYIGTGDGGGDGDPNGNAQNTGSLLGKLLRIDVSASASGQPYAIPPSNPFAGAGGGARGEIWAYGLRNPWRYAFDAATSLVYIGDVGQNNREEIDVASVAQGGLNYGWNIREGSACFSGANCDQPGLTPPVLDYGHTNDANGGCAVVGGYVYRGAAIPELQGSYLYADLCGGWLKSFAYANGAVTRQSSFGDQNIGAVLSFGQDAQRELYLLSEKGVYRIVRR